MAAIQLQKLALPEYEQSPSVLFSMKISKTAKDERFSYAAGEARLRTELEYKLKDETPKRRKELISNYIEKYCDLCDTIYNALKDLGIGSKDEKNFIVEACSILYSNLKMKYKSTDFLYQFIDSLGSKNPELDCDTSACVIFDVGRRLEINGLQMLYVSAPYAGYIPHGLVRTANFGFETTEGTKGNCILTLKELDDCYPVKYIASSNLEVIQSIIFVVRGSDREEKGDYDGAFEDYTEALRRCPRLADAYAGIGTIKFRRGEIASATENYKRAIEINQWLPNGYDGLGNIEFKSGNYQKAKENFQMAVKLNPAESNYRKNLGCAEMQLKNYGKAITACTEAIRQNPKNSNAYYGRGAAYFSLGDYQNALADYRRAIELNPKNADASKALHELENWLSTKK